MRLAIQLKKVIRHVFGIGLLFPVVASAQSIVFDISRDQPIYLHDDGYAGSSLFAADVYKHGYHISLNQLPLDQFLLKNKPDLLVLTPTVFHAHAAQEVWAVQNYVKAGGKLWVIAEHENYFNNATELNRFIEGSGIKILPERAEVEKASHFIETFRPRAITSQTNKDSVIFYYPATLALKDTTWSRAKTPDGKYLAAIASFGAGKIGVMTDLEIIWNMTYKTGYGYGQNKRFVMGMIQEFVGSGKPSHLTSALKGKNIWLNETCFESDLEKTVSYKPLIDALKKKGYGIRYANMANAEPGENDIYIGLCACETKTEMNAVLNFKRVFLAGFDKTDFWKNITSAVDDFTARGYDVRDMYATLQSVWNYDGYAPVSWQDSLEQKLGMLISRKLSYSDSTHKTGVVPNYVAQPSASAEVAKFPVSMNIVAHAQETFYAFGATSGEGVYYPCPTENNIRLTAEVSANKVSNPLFVVASDRKIISTTSSLWMNDYPDKAFQQMAIKAVVQELTK